MGSTDCNYADMRVLCLLLIIIAVISVEAQRGRGRDRGRGSRGRGKKLAKIFDDLCNVDPRDICARGEKGYYRSVDDNGGCDYSELPENEVEIGDECTEDTIQICFLCADRRSKDVNFSQIYRVELRCEENECTRKSVIDEDNSTCN